MKLLIISEFWPTYGNPISGVFVQYQAAAYARAGHQVTVVAPCAAGYRALQRPFRMHSGALEVWSPRTLWIPWMRYYPAAIRAQLYIWGARAYQETVLRWLKSSPSRGDFDAIHVNGHGFAGLCLPAVRRRLPRQSVITLHGMDPVLCSILGDARIRQMLVASWDATDYIAVCGTPLRSHAEGLGAPPHRVCVIPNGNDHFPLPSASPEEARATIIISVANLTSTKGIDVTIGAIRTLLDRRPDLSVRYWVVGDGPERANLVSLVERLRLGGCVKFFGRLPHEETLRLIARADLMCVPSSVEAFGIVYLEAMASGKPAIGCRETGARDIIIDGETGYLAPAGDIGALVEMLERLVTNESLRQRLGQAALARAREFTWAANVRRYEQFLGCHRPETDSVATSSG